MHYSYNTDSSRSYTGVGGWLWLLIFGLVFGGPFFGFAKLSMSFENITKEYPQLVANLTWQNYTKISWLLFFISIALTIIAGIRLSRVHNQKSVKFAIMTIWFSGVGAGMLQILTSQVMFGVHFASTMTIALYQSLLAAIIWHTYLLKSVRVKNTYMTK